MVTLIMLIGALLTAVLGLVLGKIAGNTIKRVLKGMEINQILKEQLNLKIPLEQTLSYIIAGIIYLITLILTLTQLGVETRVLKYIALMTAFILVLFSFLAFKDWVPNLVAGFYLTKTKKIKTGDTIKVKGVTGRVKNISLLETRVDTGKEEIFIPNSIMIKSEVKKW